MTGTTDCGALGGWVDGTDEGGFAGDVDASVGATGGVDVKGA